MEFDVVTNDNVFVGEIAGDVPRSGETIFMHGSLAEDGRGTWRVVCVEWSARKSAFSSTYSMGATARVVPHDDNAQNWLDAARARLK